MLENIIDNSCFDEEKKKVDQIKSEVNILSMCLKSILEKDEALLIKRFLQANNELVEREKANSFKLALMLGITLREVGCKTGLNNDEIFHSYVRR